MYIVSIKTAPGTSSVPVARFSDLEQSISFGFQLHNIASCKHYIVVEQDNETLATFVRKDAFTLPNPNAEKKEEKKILFAKK